ncbi:MAG: hypothetical protein QOG75_4693 [Mycobacterium sp.]|nr:hypothetical protein [Mycobacterium sp.]
MFDNCEHVLDSVADLIGAILTASTTVKVLATSREGLGVGDEQLWRVPSLEVGAAAGLFVERAHSVSSDTWAESEAVEEICRRLDGIPLAIELAASRMASMTATEMRDRLDDRFRLLVGSRRGLGRHQTLRHAVAWSYDLLEDAERSLLERCSVFVGGFDLQSACAVGGFDDLDHYQVLDLLDALVRKSLLVADRSSGQTRFSMLETIRQFADEHLVARGDAIEARNAHARYFADREADILALWDSPRQRDAYTWLITELANLRTAFRWAADRADLDTAIGVALCAHFLSIWVEQYEPVTWVEELLDAARTVGHRRLAHLYVAAAQCYAAGRVGDAVNYLDASVQMTKSRNFDSVPYEVQTSSGIVYAVAGQPERWADLCRSVIAEQEGDHTVTRACLVMALYFLGNGNEARVASASLPAAADATDNPNTACFVLLAHGGAHVDSDPLAAYDSFRRALTVARESGNRQLESAIAVMLCMLVTNQGDLMFVETAGDPIDTFDYLTVTIRRYHDAGSVSLLRNPLAILAAVFDRLGRYEQAATLSGFAANAMTRASFPQLVKAIAHLRDMLGDQTYASLASKGEKMATSEIVTYVYDHINEARATLNDVSK